MESFFEERDRIRGARRPRKRGGSGCDENGAKERLGPWPWRGAVAGGSAGAGKRGKIKKRRSRGGGGGRLGSL